MSAPDILANMTRGWNRAPANVASGTGQTGISAALWTTESSELQEVWAEPDREHHIVVVQRRSFSADWFVEGRLRYSGAFQAGDLSLLAAGDRPRANMRGPFSCLHIYLPVAVVTACAEAESLADTRPELLVPGRVRDTTIERISREVLAEMREGRPLSRLRIDALGQDLAIQLLRRHSSAAGLRTFQPEPTRGGGLTSWQLRRVTEWLEAFLAEDVSLAALSAVVGLSPNHFCMAFRVSLGETPHRYVVRRRIERAKEMLADPRLNLTEVALAVGFGSSAHFATTFRKEVGVTPSAFRREMTA